MEEQKMKTIAYNPQREIITALLVLFISFSVLTSVKAQDDSLLTISRESILAMNIKNAPELTNVNLDEENTSDNFLVMRIESWMDNGSFWNSDVDEETIVTILAAKIAEWMSNKSFWSFDSNTLTDTGELALGRKEEIARGTAKTSGN
jgi:hypothetical protein